MLSQELARRLNDEEYKNWLKAGRCLLILNEGLYPFADRHMRAFHGDLLNRNPRLRKPCSTSSCKPKGNKLVSTCSVCTDWQTVILKHHRQPDATVNWDNCCPPAWRTDHWELAKAYMPRGQGKVKGADQCDASALLNLINYCDCFRSVDPKLVREVIRYRNELMHSCELRAKDEWMKRYGVALKNLARQFSHVPQMKTAVKQIEEVSQWETELLREKLQELLRAAEGGDVDAEAQDTSELRSLGGFLQANKDLGERFSAELRAINSLGTR